MARRLPAPAACSSFTMGARSAARSLARACTASPGGLGRQSRPDNLPAAATIGHRRTRRAAITCPWDICSPAVSHLQMRHHLAPPRCGAFSFRRTTGLPTGLARYSARGVGKHPNNPDRGYLRPVQKTSRGIALGAHCNCACFWGSKIRTVNSRFLYRCAPGGTNVPTQGQLADFRQFGTRAWPINWHKCAG
jgi:hypothetical protein